MTTTQPKTELNQSNETRDDLTDAYWNEHELVSITDFRDLEMRYGGGEIRTNYFERCELDNDEARYFCAVNGECFGLIPRGDCGCIAEVETALGYASKGYRYVTFALRSRTHSALKSWRNKWSKRTAPDARVSMFDASVRGTCATSD